MDAKTIVVTGISRGLGRAMAREFARLGHRVAGCARDAAAVQQLSVELGAPHVLRAVDVTDDAAVLAFASEVAATLGAPHVLLNNAALINANAPLWEVPAADFSRVVDVNLKGVHHVIRHFVPPMISAGRGVIVNFSSGWGRSTSPDVAPYCATKWGIEGLTQAMAQELPRGLAAVALNPGIIDTDMLRSCFGAGAGGYGGPEAWARKAVPFFLMLGPSHNGQALTAP